VEHTLVDEMQRYLIDESRIAYLVGRAVHLVDTVGPFSALEPALIHISAADVVSIDRRALPRVGPYTAPELRNGGDATRASNVYALGEILRALLGARPTVPTTARDLVAASTTLDAAARPTTAAFQARLSALGWLTPAHKRAMWRRGFATEDLREASLVDDLRASPSDAGTRLVYADWLDQRGHEMRAKFLRTEDAADAADVIEHHLRYVAPADDAPWRAIVARARLGGCPKTGCPGRWDALAPLPDIDNLRRCGRCDKVVRYCTTLDEAALRADPIAVDASLSRDKALDAHRHAQTPFISYPTQNPPPPRLPALEPERPRGNFVTRLFGLWRRR